MPGPDGATLALDTCLGACSVAVRAGEETVRVSEVVGTGHAERIAPMVRDALAEAGVRAADLTRICATVGPGSFMGARVGISLAKGLALPGGAACVPITTLDAIALSAPPGAAVLIDARRGQAYVLAPGGRPRLASRDEARLVAEAAPAVRGVGLSALLGEGAPGDAFPDPGAMAAWAETAAPAPLSPLYLRAPDAKPAKQAPL